jgi:predicted MFS family arabinose efflux permease
VLGTLVLLGINGALLQADVWGWTSIGVLGGFAIAIASLGLFVWRERTTAEPAVRLEILRSRSFVVSTLVGAAAWFGVLSGSVQLAIYLQEVRGLTPTETALVLLPWPLLAAVVFPRAGAIVARIGTAQTMVLSLVFALAAALLMVAFDPTTPLVVVSIVAALGGVPMSLGVVASTMTALSEFAPAEAGIAAGVFNSLRQVGSAFGVAIPAAAFDLAVADGATDLMPGSHAAFVSRAVVFAIILGAVWLLLRRPLAVPAATGGAPPQPPEPAVDSAA